VNTALLIIDIQNDYFPGGKCPLATPNLMLENANRLIHDAEKKAYPVFCIQHLSANSGSFFLPGTEGAALHPDMNTQACQVIEKHYPNSFRETTLYQELQQKHATHLIIAGAMTHMCIDSTVRAAYDLGYRITLAEDACSTKELTFRGDRISAPTVQTAYLAALNGLFCDVVSTNAIIEGS